MSFISLSLAVKNRSYQSISASPNHPGCDHAPERDQRSELLLIIRFLEFGPKHLVHDVGDLPPKHMNMLPLVFTASRHDHSVRNLKKFWNTILTERN
jgi:hypothetical protein